MERYVLIGPRGSGKSTIGRILAERSSIPFYDTDALIGARAERSIPEIFRSSGEAAFREMEREVIASLPPGPAVIATGGGAVMDQRNARLLRRGAHILYLTADPDILLERTARGDRPPLTSLPQADEIHHILRLRSRIYRGLADCCIDTGSSTAGAIVSAIIRSGGVPARSSGEDAATPIDAPLLFGITGNPVSHSRSPYLYNSLFPEYAIPGNYLFLPAASAEEAVATMKSIGAKGLSVTIPFKEAILSCLDEVDEDSVSIGAVNTVVSCGRRLYGHNTDWIGIREPLKGHACDDAVVIGAGGAAAAAVYALLSLGMDVTIANRSRERGEALARRFSCDAVPLSEAPLADLIVHATPVGMKGDEGSLVPPTLLQPGVIVFDLVYTPPMTPLLKAAEASGCRIIPGTEMFIHQAAAQFQLLTGIDPGVERVREVLSS